LFRPTALGGLVAVFLVVATIADFGVNRRVWRKRVPADFGHGHGQILIVLVLSCRRTVLRLAGGAGDIEIEPPLTVGNFQ
jgi:hypothetical protein